MEEIALDDNLTIDEKEEEKEEDDKEEKDVEIEPTPKSGLHQQYSLPIRYFLKLKKKIRINLNFIFK